MKKKAEDQEFILKIRELKAEHPFWGYRRIWAYLRYRQGIFVNIKRIYRLMRENDLLVKDNARLKAKRAKYPQRSKPRATKPHQYWGIDMTKIMIRSFGWVYLVVVLDWYTKKIVGHSLKLRSQANDWLEALEQAASNQFPEGILNKQDDLFLISDNGSQPTSKKFMKHCSVLEVKQIFTSYCNPKGNADTERVIRTIKEDFVWSKEWDSPFVFDKELSKWIDKYNTDFPHSTIGYKTPVEFERQELLVSTN